MDISQKAGNGLFLYPMRLLLIVIMLLIASTSYADLVTTPETVSTYEYGCDTSETYTTMYADSVARGSFIKNLNGIQSYLGNIPSTSVVYDPPFLIAEVAAGFANDKNQACLVGGFNMVLDASQLYSTVHANPSAYPNLFPLIVETENCPNHNDVCHDAAPYYIGGYNSTVNVPENWYSGSSGVIVREYASGPLGTVPGYRIVTESYYITGPLHKLSTSGSNSVLSNSELALFRSVSYSVLRETPSGFMGEPLQLSKIPSRFFNNYSGGKSNLTSQSMIADTASAYDRLNALAATKFPFTVVSTFIDWLDLFMSDPAPPVLKIKIGEDWEHEILSLEKFDPLATFCRYILGVYLFLLTLHSCKSKFMGVSR